MQNQLNYEPDVFGCLTTVAFYAILFTAIVGGGIFILAAR